MTTITLNDRELAAVLAGLRLLRRQDVLPRDVDHIMTDGGALPRPREYDIDALCERLNGGR